MDSTDYGREADNAWKQQYIYVIEANLTFQNGLTIPLATEFLYRDNNQLDEPEGKQDSETTAFNRLILRLKKYFPRLKIILFADAIVASVPVMELWREHHFEFIIHLPKKN